MIAFIKGQIIELRPNYLVVMTEAGVGYGIYVSINTSSTLALNSQVALKITQIIKEDSHKLYGFVDDKEQICFEELIRVNGVGSTSAMAILSSFSPEQLINALANSDVAAIKKAPGIGPKTAARLILELKDKLVSKASVNILACNNAYEEAKAALIALGFKADIAAKALNKASGNSASELIKSALKALN